MNYHRGPGAQWGTQYMPHRKKIVVLMVLWAELYPDGTAEEKRYGRLRFLAQTVGRVIDSANDLSEAELETCIRSLQDQQRATVNRPRSNIRHFPNRSQVTHEQVWKIAQIERLLGWSGVPARLNGFLRHLYHVDRPDDLTHAAAWRCIESLFDTAARAEIKAEKGQAYPVSKGELAARVAVLKRRLASPRLPSEASAQDGPAA